MSACSMPDCGRTVIARTWCSTHYWRWHTFGDPNREPLTVQERFWAKVNRTAQCWQWTASVDSSGYGQFDHKIAHRVAWEWLRGPIPEGLQLDHLCRNRRCVNPDHLEPVTAAVNTQRAKAVAPRRTHCRYGHEIGDRPSCRRCHADSERSRRQRLAA